MDTARTLVGGPLDQEMLAVSDVALSVCLALGTKPPTWARYELRQDEQLHWVGNYASIHDAIAAGFSKEIP